MEVDLNYHLEFTPACFRDFIRWFCDDSVGILVALVQFEVNFLDISLHVLIKKWFYINSPLMCMSILFSLLPKCSRDISIDNWLNFNNSLENKFIRHCLKTLKMTLLTFILPPLSGPKSLNLSKFVIYLLQMP